MENLNSFECESCGQTFDKTEGAKDKCIKEYEEQFGNYVKEEIMIVCGYCYRVAVERQKIYLIENWDVNRMTKQ